MATAPSKLDHAPLAPLLPRLDPSDEARPLLEAAATPSAAVEALLAAGLPDDALTLLAHALPKREAVWWACMCAESTAPAARPAVQRAATQAAQDWVRRPSEATARHASACADQAGAANAEAWTAIAAGWSGPSLAPEGLAAVVPPSHLTATAVLGAIRLALVRTPPVQHGATLQRFIAAARDIAAGGLGRIS